MLDFLEEEELKSGRSGGSGEHRCAVVVEVSENRMRIRFDGEQAASGKWYRGITIAPVGSRVLCAKISGSYLVLGAIL